MASSTRTKLRPPLSSQHIEAFYAALVKPSDSLRNLADACHSHFLRFLQTPSQDDKHILLNQISLLHKKGFFKGQIDPTVISSIHDAIKEGGAAFQAILADDEHLTTRLLETRAINQKAKQSQKTFPDQMCAGLSHKEREKITEHAGVTVVSVIATSTPYSDLGFLCNEQGTHHYQRKEYRQAISHFEAAIACYRRKAKPLSATSRKNLVTFYCNLASVHNEFGNECFSQHKYVEAIAQYRKAYFLYMRYRPPKAVLKQLLTTIQANLMGACEAYILFLEKKLRDLKDELSQSMEGPLHEKKHKACQDIEKILTAMYLAQANWFIASTGFFGAARDASVEMSQATARPSSSSSSHATKSAHT